MTIQDGISPGTVVPGAGGSAGDPASGTGAEAADGSEDQSAQQIEDLRLENDRKDHIIRQLLGEKSNTEAERRSLEAERQSLDRGRAISQQYREDIALIQNPTGHTAEEVAAAAARMTQALGSQVYELRNQFNADIGRLKEQQKGSAFAGVAPDVVSEASALLESGDEATMEDAVDKVIGKRAREGKSWSATAAPAPPGPGPAPAAGGAPAARPLPAGAPVAPRAIATATRSVPGAAWSVPPTMTEAEYMALPDDKFKIARAARVAGSMRLTAQ